jgi:uncharacterized protein (DUF1778 family)
MVTSRIGQVMDRDATMRSTAKKTEYPLSMRLPEQDIAIIDRAAGLRGSSRTEFVRDAAVRAAEAVLMENTLLRMSPKGFGRFVTVISAPAKPVPAMVKLLKRKSPWEIRGKRT